MASPRLPLRAACCSSYLVGEDILHLERRERVLHRRGVAVDQRLLVVLNVAAEPGETDAFELRFHRIFLLRIRVDLRDLPMLLAKPIGVLW